MSRIYFHSPSGDAELHGSERVWLGHVAEGPAVAAWDLDRSSALERCTEILAMVPEVPDGAHGANYLHTYLREALAQAERNKVCYKGWGPGQPMRGQPDHEPIHRLVKSLQVSLRVQGVTLNVAGVELRSANLDLNTALVAGSDPVRLAAKIHGWCEAHAYVEGPDRAWMATIIDQGLKAGIYRHGLWYADQPDGPKDKWSDQGWEGVQALLRSRDDEPVVLSYSVCDQFPNREVANWGPPSLPDDWAPDWVVDDKGREEWAALSEDDRASYWHDHASDLWYDLPAEQRWESAMAGLRAERSWARLGPDTLAEVTFGLPVSVYDLFAPDRDERIRAAAALESGMA